MSGAFNDDVRLAGEALWKVLLASLVLGAGLPAVFALGIRSLAWGNGGSAESGAAGSADGTTTVGRGGNPAGRILAVVLFLVVAYAIVAGLIYIIASGQGKDISFSHIVPTIAAKKA